MHTIKNILYHQKEVVKNISSEILKHNLAKVVNFNYVLNLHIKINKFRHSIFKFKYLSFYKIWDIISIFEAEANLPDAYKKKCIFILVSSCSVATTASYFDSKKKSLIHLIYNFTPFTFTIWTLHVFIFNLFYIFLSLFSIAIVLIM